MIVLALYGNYIPTNTPAIQQYAFQVMFTNAQALGASWHLDQTVITSNNITRFDARAHPRQIYANIQFGERYLFGTSKAGYVFFSDSNFGETSMPVTMDPAFVNRYGSASKSWTQTTNSLSLEDAQKVAESAMHAYGVPAAELGFLQPKLKEQLKSGDKLLPYYKFEWETEKGRCKVHVSGLITNIVQFEFEGSEPLRLKPPSNYLDLLGLSTNTIFVKQISSGKYMRYAE